MAFEFQSLGLRDVVVVKPQLYSDERGFLVEGYNKEEFVKAGITEPFVQSKHSFSVKGTLRGLHYQKKPMAQGKLVQVTFGQMYIVIVDLRHGSPTFRKWESMYMDQDEQGILWIPEGFALGSFALKDSIMNYHLTKGYSKEHEAGITWKDPSLQIKWPFTAQPIVSERDSALPEFSESTIYFEYSES